VLVGVDNQSFTVEWRSAKRNLFGDRNWSCWWPQNKGH